jgi:hypothetical protein
MKYDGSARKPPTERKTPKVTEGNSGPDAPLKKAIVDAATATTKAVEAAGNVKEALAREEQALAELSKQGNPNG